MAIIFKMILVDRSAGGPFPADHRLPSSSGIRHHVLSLIEELVVGPVVVVKDVQVSGIQEVAVLGVTEVNDPAFLALAIGVGHFHAVIAEAGLHAAHSIEGNKALGEALGLVVPALAGVDIVRKVGGESVGDLRCTVHVASNGLIADIGPWNLQVLLDLKGQRGSKEKD